MVAKWWVGACALAIGLNCLPAMALAQTDPSSDPAVQAYLAYQLPNIQALQQSIQLFTIESGLMASNPTLMFDRQWRVQMVTALAGMEFSGQALQKAPSVPDSLQDVDTDLSDAGFDYDLVAKQVAQGLDAMDASILVKANANMVLANNHIIHAAKLLDSLGITSTELPQDGGVAH